jgi:hypothetical protein
MRADGLFMLDAYRISENVDGQTFFGVFRMMEPEMSLYNRMKHKTHTHRLCCYYFAFRQI